MPKSQLQEVRTNHRVIENSESKSFNCVLRTFHSSILITGIRKCLRMGSFKRDLHVKSLLSMLEKLPSDYQGQDSHRLTLAYFVVSALDILNALDQVDAKWIMDWVYHLQVLPSDEAEDKHGFFYGFQGSSSVHLSKHARVKFNNGGIGHLASTYSALALLKIMGDDFTRIDCKRISRTMKNLQQPDGSFTSLHTGAETDLRFVFCAAICFMLNDWSGMNVDKALSYIMDCQSYDAGFGLTPGAESHGGATYCAIAALKLMGYITDDPVSKRPSCSVFDFPSLVEWSLWKQRMDGGFQGRSNKDSDTCYSFWVGGSLKLMGFHDFYDWDTLRCFLLSCQSEFGGFSKEPGEFPEAYHSYYALCGFSLLEEPGLNPLCCELGISEQAKRRSPCAEGLCL